LGIKRRFNVGIGGSGYENHRIWIDAKDLSQSYIQEDDMTFESGSIIESGKINLDVH
jgi:hypothetical protein